MADAELVSAIDNPMVLPDGRVESCGNFHGAPVALACDFLAIAAAEVGAIAERRTDRLLDASRSHGLPPFLAPDAGVDSGLMIAQYTQAAMVAENRRLAAPAAVDSLPTSAMQEDHVSMGWGAARKLRAVVANLRRILAVELTAAHARARAAGSARPRGGHRGGARRRARGGRRPGPRSLAGARAARGRGSAQGWVAAGRGRECGGRPGMTVIGSDIAEAYRRDGAVAIRGLLTTTQVAELREGIDRNRAEPGPLAQGHGAGQTFFEDFCNWRRIGEFERVIRDAELGRVGAELMHSRSARLFHDHVLVKEAGSAEPSPWHQDQPYYCVDGTQNVSFWIPVDPVGRDATLEFAAGSHASGTWYMPRTFISKAALVFDEGELEEVPDIEADRSAHEILGWDLQPGDAVAFHMLTLHQAGGSPSLRRAFSVRLLGDDATFAPRPHTTSPPFPGLDSELAAGEPLDNPRFPLLHPPEDLGVSGPREVRAPRGLELQLPRLAAGGAAADADEQPRPGGGRAPRRPRRLRRHRPGGALVGRLRRDRRRAAPRSPTTRRCWSSRASRWACSARTSGRRAC